MASLRGVISYFIPRRLVGSVVEAVWNRLGNAANTESDNAAAASPLVRSPDQVPHTTETPSTESDSTLTDHLFNFRPNDQQRPNDLNDLNDLIVRAQLLFYHLDPKQLAKPDNEGETDQSKLVRYAEIFKSLQAIAKELSIAIKIAESSLPENTECLASYNCFEEKILKPNLVKIKNFCRNNPGTAFYVVRSRTAPGIGWFFDDQSLLDGGKIYSTQLDGTILEQFLKPSVITAVNQVGRKTRRQKIENRLDNLKNTFETLFTESQPGALEKYLAVLRDNGLLDTEYRYKANLEETLGNILGTQSPPNKSKLGSQIESKPRKLLRHRELPARRKVFPLPQSKHLEPESEDLEPEPELEEDNYDQSCLCSSTFFQGAAAGGITAGAVFAVLAITHALCTNPVGWIIAGVLLCALIGGLAALTLEHYDMMPVIPNCCSC